MEKIMDTNNNNYEVLYFDTRGNNAMWFAATSIAQARRHINRTIKNPPQRETPLVKYYIHDVANYCNVDVGEIPLKSR
jgi:hypothetical protein